MIKPMPEGQASYPIPEEELERRWALVRKSLDEHGLDALIVQNEGQDLGGYVRWLTDNAAGYPVTVFFPGDGGMTVINSGDPQFPGKPPKGAAVKLTLPYFRTLRITEHYDAEALAAIVKKSGKRRIGLVNLGRMHACFYNYLTEALPEVAFVDFTDAIDALKAVKSPTELRYIREVMALHDKILGAVPAMLYPGIRERDLYLELHRYSCQLGGEGQIVLLIGSAPIGQSFNYGPLAAQNRRISYGDQFMVMLESSGPAGFFAEMSRYWCLGEPDENLINGWAAAREAQRMASRMLRPGADLSVIFEEVNEYLVGEGYAPEGRILGHGQGYDLVERPGILAGETMPAMANMVFALHPSAISDKANVFCCDNYLVTDSGSERLQKFPQEIIIL